MFNKKHPPWLRYGTAAAIVLLVSWLAALLQPLPATTVFSLFFAAVMVAAWYGGLGPGLLATMLAVFVIDAFFLSQPGLFLSNVHSIVRLIVFVLVALLISSLTAARRRAVATLQKAHDELEARVQERTRELADINQALRAEIVERKEAESRLAQATRELVERNKELLRLQREMARVEPLAALGQITATVAHELGTPLNSVLGYCQLLGEEELSESVRRRLNIIEAQVRRMVGIIDSHLSRTRGALPEYRQVDINRLVREILALFGPVFQQHKISVTPALSDSLPPVRGDPASLQQLFINLLNNAVDAVGEEGRVTVATRLQAPSESGSPGILMEVTDDGPGIPPEILPRIFDLFVTTKAPGKGTGLGLAICQEIVKAHRGAIEITSRATEGTCARIFLPADEQAGRFAAIEGER